MLPIVMSPGVSNLLQILEACGRTDIVAQFVRDYAGGIRRYAALKDAVADVLVALTTDLRTRRAEFERDGNGVLRLIYAMADGARQPTLGFRSDPLLSRATAGQANSPP